MVSVQLPNYAMVAAPLSALTGGPKKGSISLDERQMAAFEAVKQALVSPAVLAVEDPEISKAVESRAAGQQRRAERQSALD